jgi:predicted phage tail protein
VRAGWSGGNVHAALVPGSAEAAQALSTQLPGLSTYLAEEHTRVSTLTMATPDDSWAATGYSQASQHGAGQEAGQHAATEPQTSSTFGATTIGGVFAQSQIAASSAADQFFPIGEARGTHVSVIA